MSSIQTPEHELIERSKRMPQENHMYDTGCIMYAHNMTYSQWKNEFSDPDDQFAAYEMNIGVHVTEGAPVKFRINPADASWYDAVCSSIENSTGKQVVALRTPSGKDVSRYSADDMQNVAELYVETSDKGTTNVNVNGLIGAPLYVPPMSLHPAKDSVVHEWTETACDYVAQKIADAIHDKDWVELRNIITDEAVLSSMIESFLKEPLLYSKHSAQLSSKDKSAHIKFLQAIAKSTKKDVEPTAAFAEIGRLMAERVLPCLKKNESAVQEWHANNKRLQTQKMISAQSSKEAQRESKFFASLAAGDSMDGAHISEAALGTKRDLYHKMLTREFKSDDLQHKIRGIIIIGRVPRYLRRRRRRMMQDSCMPVHPCERKQKKRYYKKDDCCESDSDSCSSSDSDSCSSDSDSDGCGCAPGKCRCGRKGSWKTKYGMVVRHGYAKGPYGHKMIYEDASKSATVGQSVDAEIPPRPALIPLSQYIGRTVVPKEMGEYDQSDDDSFGEDGQQNELFEGDDQAMSDEDGLSDEDMLDDQGMSDEEILDDGDMSDEDMDVSSSMPSLVNLDEFHGAKNSMPGLVKLADVERVKSSMPGLVQIDDFERVKSSMPGLVQIDDFERVKSSMPGLVQITNSSSNLVPISDEMEEESEDEEEEDESEDEEEEDEKKEKNEKEEDEKKEKNEKEDMSGPPNLVRANLDEDDDAYIVTQDSLPSLVASDMPRIVNSTLATKAAVGASYKKKKTQANITHADVPFVSKKFTIQTDVSLLQPYVASYKKVRNQMNKSNALNSDKVKFAVLTHDGSVIGDDLDEHFGDASSNNINSNYMKMNNSKQKTIMISSDGNLYHAGSRVNGLKLSNIFVNAEDPSIVYIMLTGANA